MISNYCISWSSSESYFGLLRKYLRSQKIFLTQSLASIIKGEFDLGVRKDEVNVTFAFIDNPVNIQNFHIRFWAFSEVLLELRIRLLIATFNNSPASHSTSIPRDIDRLAFYHCWGWGKRNGTLSRMTSASKKHQKSGARSGESPYHLARLPAEINDCG